MSSYSEDEFDLSLSAAVSSSSVGDTGPDTKDIQEEDGSSATCGRGDAGFEPRVLLLPNDGGNAGEAGEDGADASDAGYSSFNDGEESLPLISPSFTVGERDGRTNKQVGPAINLWRIDLFFNITQGSR